MWVFLFLRSLCFSWEGKFFNYIRFLVLSDDVCRIVGIVRGGEENRERCFLRKSYRVGKFLSWRYIWVCYRVGESFRIYVLF